MKWYEGSIPDAIQLAKSKRSIFIVYITGQDEESRKMDAVWVDPTVIDTCQRADCVAIQLAAKSDACAQFSMFYPVVVVPSVFLIGNNGIPLEVTGGAMSVDDFNSKVKTALQSHRVDQAGAVADSNDTPSQSQQAAASDTPSIQDKVEKAKQLILQKQAQKSQEEQEKNIEDEKERRQLGQSMLESKQRKQEAEARDVQRELKRKKEEDRLARERVKEQIAIDRAERAERFQKEKTASEHVRQEESRARQESEREAATELAARRSETARLQFRLPDGSSVTQSFPSGDTLSTAQDFITQHVGSTFGPLMLSTLYPRRSFTSDDLGTSLSSLQLSPSAVIMVLPEQRSSPSSGPLTDRGILALILAPLIAIWNFVYSIIFASPSRPRGAYNPGASAQTSSMADSDDDNVPTESNPRPNRPRTAYKRRTPPSVSKKDGNVHKFSNADDDEDMATWNGNSTQQM